MVTTPWRRIQEVLAGLPAGTTASLRGWIYRTRSSGNIVFMTLRDATGVIQVTIKKGNLPDPRIRSGQDRTHRILRGTLRRGQKRPPGARRLRDPRFIPARGELSQNPSRSPKTKARSSSSTSGTSGCAPANSRPRSRSGPRSSERYTSSSATAGSTSSTHPSSSRTNARAAPPSSK